MTPLKTIAIIANGDTPRHPQVLAALAQCDGCVCCDRLPPDGAPPLLQIVGDLDSVTGDIAPALLTDLHEDQETNDLTKAMRWVNAKHPTVAIHYFAVTGKREDHTLANLALITEAGLPTRIFTESGRFDLFPAGSHTLAVEMDEPISFLSFIPQSITARGVVWPVEQLRLTSLWRATLNKTAAPQVEVTCESPLLVYRPWRTEA
jgi:thiamine pyrophosphokinase